jgi:hypothetical protein
MPKRKADAYGVLTKFDRVSYSDAVKIAQKK